MVNAFSIPKLLRGICFLSMSVAGGVGSFGLCAVCLEVPVGNVGGDGGRVSTSQE